MTFDEYWEETKEDHMSDFKNWLVSDIIYSLEANEDRVHEYLKYIWNAARQNMTTRDI